MAKHAKATSSSVKVPSIAFLMVSFLLVLIPFVGMAVCPTNSTSENRTLAEMPSLIEEDGTVNVNILSELGTYFEDHFAFRNVMVSANARLRAPLQSSPTDEVVAGSDGWLYYGGTLSDYLGQSELSDRALWNIAHNLSLLQGYAKANGASFLFVVAPNKNSLYDEGMPYYYLESTNASNWDRLKPYLDSFGIVYLDAFDLLDDQDEVLYYKTDTHWTNKGALLVANALLVKTGHTTISTNGLQSIRRYGFTGDVEGMLYPDFAQEELDVYYAGINDSAGLSGSLWSYLNGNAVTDNQIATKSNGEGSLVMYRDSFGNALIPYLSTEYGAATYSKMIPYNAYTIVEQKADTVIVERAERHLSYLAESAPIMGAPSISPKSGIPASDDPNATETTLSVSYNGSYVVLEGCIDDRIVQPTSKILVEVVSNGTKRTYEAFTISTNLADGSVDYEDEALNGEAATKNSDYGFTLYLGKDVIDVNSATVKVFIFDGVTSSGAKTFSKLSTLVH